MFWICRGAVDASGRKLVMRVKSTGFVPGKHVLIIVPWLLSLGYSSAEICLSISTLICKWEKGKCLLPGCHVYLRTPEQGVSPFPCWYRITHYFYKMGGLSVAAGGFAPNDIPVIWANTLLFSRVAICIGYTDFQRKDLCQNLLEGMHAVTNSFARKCCWHWYFWAWACLTLLC